jgi:hypothetical protein
MAANLRKPPKKHRRTPKNSATSPKAIARQERKLQALELRRIGYTYRAIGKEMGLNHCTVLQMVVEAIAEIPRESAEAVLRLELARLDEMQSSIYTTAVEGDHNAILTVLRIMERRARLEGIERPAAMNVNAQITGADGAPLIPANLPLVNFIFTDKPLPNEGMTLPSIEGPTEAPKEEKEPGPRGAS